MIKKIAYYSIFFSIICIVLNLTILTEIPISIFSEYEEAFLALSLITKNLLFLPLALITLILSILTLLQIKKNKIIFPIIMIILHIIDLFREIVMITNALQYIIIFMNIYYIIILVIYCCDILLIKDNKL